MFELFLAELKRLWTEFIRYPIDAVRGIILNTLLFYGLFLSGRYITSSRLQFGDQMDSTVIKYALWILVVFTVKDTAIALEVEAQTGTLEQLFLSPFGLPKVLLARTFASLTLRLVLIMGVLLITIVLTGQHLHFPPSLLLPLVAVLLGACGLAFIVGALVLLFKHIERVLKLIQLPLLFLLIVPTESWVNPLQWLKLLLPMTLGAGELQVLMTTDQSLNLSALVPALLNGIGYFIFGFFFFSLGSRSSEESRNIW